MPPQVLATWGVNLGRQGKICLSQSSGQRSTWTSFGWLGGFTGEQWWAGGCAMPGDGSAIAANGIYGSGYNTYDVRKW